VRALHRSSFGARLRSLRMAKGLSQVDLARLIGRHQTVIGPYERDEYEPPRDIVQKLAHVLDTSPEYLYFGRSPARSTIPIGGRFGIMGVLEPASNEAEAPLTMREDQLLAFRVGDDSMAPVFRPGQIALIGALEASADDLLGRDALVELAEGRALLRRLALGADRRCYDLAAYNAPTLAGVEVSSARPILGVLWPEACGGSAAATGFQG
jgi:transcriptional regulator with XRE-family HTH domain